MVGVFIGCRPPGVVCLLAITLFANRQTTLMPFRFQARYALLTYAQCGDLDPFLVVDHLSGLGAECIIGRENHADGGLHLHAFVDFGKQYRTSNVQAFDVEGFHPNVSPSRGRPGEGYDYAVKDGDIVAGGLERPDGKRVSSTGGEWSTLLSAESEQDFWRLCEELVPRDMVRSFTSFYAFAQWRFAPKPPIYEQPVGITIETSHVAELDDWVRENVEGHRGRGVRGMSLILYGPTRMGKTIWARSLSQDHAYFGGMFSLDEDISNAQYAVFDDMELKYLPRWKFWLGHQNQFYETDKYRKKVLIHWNKPAIWCSNTDPRNEFGITSEQVDWLNSNCVFCYVDEPMVKTSE